MYSIGLKEVSRDFSPLLAVDAKLPMANMRLSLSRIFISSLGRANGEGTPNAERRV